MKQKSIFALVLGAILVLTISNTDAAFADYYRYDDSYEKEHDRNDDRDENDDRYDDDDKSEREEKLNNQIV